METAAPRRLGLSIVPFVLLLAVYLPTLQELVLDWYYDDNYSHGFFVPLVAAFLLWRKRDQLTADEVRSDWRGLVIAIIGLTIFVLGNGAAEYFTVRFSFVVTLFGLVYYLYGARIIRKVWYSLFFLVFMIPIPYVIYYAVAFPMQRLATTITVVALKMIGMSVIQQGNIIHLPEYTLEVVEACSGIRSLVSLLALGALFAYLTQKRFLAQAILFLSTIPIAIFANVVRVFVTSFLAYSFGGAVAEDPLHTILGMSVFVVAFITMFIEGLILKQVFK